MMTTPSGQPRTRTLSALPPQDTALLTVCAVAFTIPLTIAPWASNAFELPKVVVLRALVLILAALLGARTLASGRACAMPARQWLRHPLVATVLAFMLVLTASTLLSTDRRVSLLGSYERQQGLLTLLTYVTLFLCVTLVLRTRQHVDLLWRALVWASAPVVLYGLLQALGLDPLAWQSDSASPVLSTVGRSNFLGTYLVLIIPLTWGQLLVARTRAGLMLLWAGQLACLALTHARGAWLGLAVATLAFALIWASSSGQHHLRRLLLLAGLLIGALILLLGIWLLEPGADPHLVIARTPLQKLADLTTADPASIQARLTIWQAALPLLQARPWFGYGPETLRNVFVTAYPPQLVYYQGRQAVVDRAHNLWLDLGLSSGLAGIVTFGAVLLAFFWLAGRGLRSARDVWTRALWTALLAAVIGHLADLHLSFEVTATAATFWLLLAIAAALSRPDGLPDTEPVPVVREPSRRGLTIALLAVALLAWLPLGVLPLWADAAHWQSQQPAQPLPARLAVAQHAVQLNPREPAYRLNLAARWLEAGDWPAAAAEARQALALAPHDPTLWAALGDLQARWGEQDRAHYAAAAAAYRQALALAPTVAAYHTALGLILVQDGQLAAGTQALQRAVDLDQTDAVAYLYLGDAHLAQGQVHDAKTAYERALHWNPGIARAYTGLARCYAQLGDLPAAEAMHARAQQLAEGTPTSR